MMPQLAAALVSYHFRSGFLTEVVVVVVVLGGVVSKTRVGMDAETSAEGGQEGGNYLPPLGKFHRVRYSAREDAPPPPPPVILGYGRHSRVPGASVMPACAQSLSHLWQCAHPGSGLRTCPGRGELFPNKHSDLLTR